MVSQVRNAQVRSQEPRRQVLQGVQGALLAAVMAAGIGLAPPAELMQVARADMSAPERRKAEAQQRRELLAKAWVAAWSTHWRRMQSGAPLCGQRHSYMHPHGPCMGT